jgi:hypothetical protein
MNLTEEAFESYNEEFWRKEDTKRVNGAGRASALPKATWRDRNTRPPPFSA